MACGDRVVSSCVGSVLNPRWAESKVANFVFFLGEWEILTCGRPGAGEGGEREGVGKCVSGGYQDSGLVFQCRRESQLMGGLSGEQK